MKHHLLFIAVCGIVFSGYIFCEDVVDYSPFFSVVKSVEQYRRSLDEQVEAPINAATDDQRDQFRSIWEKAKDGEVAFAALISYWSVEMRRSGEDARAQLEKLDKDIEAIKGRPKSEWATGFLELERLRFMSNLVGMTKEQYTNALLSEIEYIKNHINDIGQFDQAPKDVRDAVQTLSGNHGSYQGKALWYIAARYESMRSYDNARVYFKKIIEKFPHLPEAENADGAIRAIDAMTKGK